MSDLDGRKLVRLRYLTFPPAGGWEADVTLSDGGAPALGRATITIGDLPAAGCIVTTGIDAPDQPRVVIRGGAGWGATLPRAGNYKGGSVRLSTVLRDLADLARTDPADASTAEPYDSPTDVILGADYRWPLSTERAPVHARIVLAALILRGAIPTWRVATNGRTRFDAWPSLPPADGAGRLQDPRNLARGVRRYALDTRAAAFLPGATVEEKTIRRVTFREDANGLTCECWSV